MLTRYCSYFSHHYFGIWCLNIKNVQYPITDTFHSLLRNARVPCSGTPSRQWIYKECGLLDFRGPTLRDVRRSSVSVTAFVRNTDIYRHYLG